MTLNILLVSEYFPPIVHGGGELSAYALAKALTHKGVNVSVLTSHFANLPVFEKSLDGFKIFRRLSTGKNPSSITHALKRKLIFPRTLNKELRKLENEIHPDIIHFLNTTSIIGYKPHTSATTIASINSYGNFCPKSNLFYRDKKPCTGSCNVIKYHACLTKSDYIGKVRLGPYLKYNPFFWAVAYVNYMRRKRALSTVDRFIVCNKLIKNRLTQLGYGQITHTIPNVLGIDIDTNPSTLPELAPQIKHNEVTILYIGSLEKIKGVDLLIDVFNNTCANNLTIELVVVGDGSEKTNLLNIANNNPNITFIDNIDYKHISSVYNQSDIVVIPSRWPEPLSRVMLEATCFAKPIIASDVGGNPDGVVNGRNGFLFTSSDELQDNLLHLINCPKCREKMGSESRKIFNSRFSNVIDRYMDVYMKTSDKDD